MGTRFGGVSRYDGKSFTNLTINGDIPGGEVWSVYEDKMGNIWFPAEGFGVYRYDGKTFTNFYTDEGLASHAIQSIYEDKQGRLWLGGWKGLFRYDGKSIFPVTKYGPWAK
jgi:ligand-binding sensor domain-containing protein